MPLEFSCGAVIFKERKKERNYLLLCKEEGYWEFAKGNKENSETAKATVIREAREETGIRDLKFVEGFKEKTSWFYKRENKTIYKQVVWLLAETKKEKIKLSFEHKGYKWLAYGEALKQLTFKDSKKLLTKANNLLERKVKKT
ncbi:NUDIX domain-containing protein [Candidatus Woesearchaeota archaeon]|nr:NUDIX domain-containing protein [Candidatus Woesearchaeota archaeon]